MAVMPNFAMLMLLLFGGGGNDLLDYAQTDAYWKAKGVTVSVEQLSAELVPPKADDVAKLIRQLGAEDPAAREAATQKIMQAGPAVLPQLKEAANGVNREVANRASNLVEALKAAGKAAEVRRLMAIRTLGELKKPEAVAGLKLLLDSREQFVAEYAANAIAAIEGKPSRREGFPDKARAGDLNLLPAQVDGVGQYVFGNGSAATLEQLLGTGLALMPAEDRKALFSEITKAVVELADKVGNLRFDQATAGFYANLPNAPGWNVVILRGRWDAAALYAASEPAALLGFQPDTVDGVHVLRGSATEALILASDEMAVLVMGEQKGTPPIEAMVAAVKKGTNDFATNADLAKLLAGVDKTATLWAAMKVTDGLRQQLPSPANVFDAAWFTVHRKADNLDIHWQGTGKDADAVKAASAEMMRNADEGAKALGDMAKATPGLQVVVDFLKSVHCTTDGSKLEGGATLKNAVQMLPMMLIEGGMRASVDVDPHPQPVVKPEPKK